jgi:energy-coupling factor transporter ATP-binding protein EcfA2
MYRIHQLRLQYFKGFQTKGTFTLEGRNVLLYGTNGSGKSSLYWALYTMLQASIKPDGVADAQRRYFGPYDANLPNTHQSLRNAYAPTLGGPAPQEELETTLEIECRDQQNSALPPRHFRLSQSSSLGYDAASLVSLQETTLASDFLYYRQLQDFSLTSNKNAVNLWPVFLRDLFPYDRKPGAPASPGNTFESRLRELLRTFPRKPNGTPKSSSFRVYIDWETQAQQFNSDIGLYLDGLEQSANGLLNGAFSDGENKLTIRFLWNSPDDPRQLTGKLVGNLNHQLSIDEQVAELRADRPTSLRLSFRVEMWDAAGNILAASDRPQSFLNEARLTRVALSVRIAALLNRLPTNDLRLLCLDDLLVSLDSSNRWLVIRWLFDSTANLGQKFQILFFTHDRELYRLMRHQIEVNRQENKWCYYELFANENHTKEPSILPTSNAYLDRARTAFESSPPDFPSCANYLRKEVERLLKRFLPPPAQRKKSSSSETIGERSLGELIKQLIELHEKQEPKEPLGDLEKLDLYRELHLNPLSHDNPGTAIYQKELRELMDSIVPNLTRFDHQILLPLREYGETFIELHQTEADGSGLIQRHLLRLHEPLRALVFPSGRVSVTHPLAQWKGRIKNDGTLEVLPNDAKTPIVLDKLYKMICDKSRGKLQKETKFWELLITSNRV